MNKCNATSRYLAFAAAILAVGLASPGDAAAAKQRSKTRSAGAEVSSTRADGTPTTQRRRATTMRRAKRAQRSERAEGSAHVSRATNDRTMQRLMQRIGEQAATGVAPVVQVDLDLTALMPIERTRDALRDIGRDYDIPELTTPETLGELPGYTPEAFTAWVETSGLGQRYPALRGIRSLQGYGYWNSAHDTTDQVTPGLVDFVAAVRSAGGEVVFNSGRSESMRGASEGILRRAGINNPVLYIGNIGGDAATKESRQGDIRARYGKTVAVVDDRVTNRDAVISGLGDRDVISIAIAIPGFSVDPVTRQAENALTTFTNGQAQ